MGVYVFQSIHEPVFKIGHYAKQNAWSRVGHRGFGKILHPRSLTGKVSVHDLSLILWCPLMTTKDEKRLHRLCVAHHVIGEWFSMDALPLLQHEFKNNQAALCSKEAALQTRRRL